MPRHAHRQPAMPPWLLGLVLIGALLVAIGPFAIVIAAMDAGMDESFGLVLAAITAAILAFPLIVAATSPRRHHPREPAQEQV